MWRSPFSAAIKNARRSPFDDDPQATSKIPSSQQSERPMKRARYACPPGCQMRTVRQAVPDSPMDAPRLLHEFFERAVLRNPDGIAIDVPGTHSRPRRRISYADLDRRARAIARRLAALVVPGDVVAIFVPRHDTDAFAAQLAVMRAGCAYTCIDPSFPDAHASFIVADASVKVLIADESSATRARAAGFPVAHVVELQDVTAAEEAPQRAATAPTDLAYVIYTSGTTG